ncbi:UNVERIFIED_CONTAM: Kanadaptin [Siphonaria sp. JEL0065]|nr:Kanadaptin [Siphonaria sp. JEL0065]
MSSFALPSLPASKLKTVNTGSGPVPAVPGSKESEATKESEHQLETPPPPPKLNYEVPDWSSLCPPDSPFWFEVVKSGSIVDKIKARKPVMVVGRLPTCDVSLEHASVSRQHAVIQSSDSQLFIFDLGSAHSTFVNKAAVPPRKHIRVKNGDLIKFGQSTRVFVVMGGPDEEEEEAEEAAQKVVFKEKQQPPQQKKPTDEKDHEVSWGFAEDASNDDEGGNSSQMMLDDDDASIDLDGSVPDPDAYYFKDSKKALKTWCDSKSMDMLFSFDEEGHGVTKVFVATINLNLDGGYTLTGTGKGARKKEAERQAALDACIKLDRRNILRSTGAAKKSEFKRKSSQNDDNDSFYDRTERPKKPKLQSSNVAETFESLTEKVQSKMSEIAVIDAEIVALDSLDTPLKPAGDAEDELDQLLTGLESSTKLKQKRVLSEKRRVLAQELTRLSKMLEIAKPHNMNVSPSTSTPAAKTTVSIGSTDSKDPTHLSPTRPKESPIQQSRRSPSPQRPASPSFTAPLPKPFLKPATKPESFPAPLATKRSVTFEDDEPQPQPTLQKLQNDTPTESTTTISTDAEPKKPSGRRRTFLVMTKQQVSEHERVEKEEMVDAIQGGSGKVEKEEVSRYGY